MENTTVATLESRLVDSIEGTLHVPAYQRGYRWDPLQVEQLLNDIEAAGDKPYILQPVTVKQRADGSWEVIDGQQRLTTLYLIYRCMHDEGWVQTDAPYSISYETRPDSADFLAAPMEEFAAESIDFSFMWTAYETIRDWFTAAGRQAQVKAVRFLGSLQQTVRVIWYQVPDDADGPAVFTRLNIGRIPLTDAELVKASLLTKIDKQVGAPDRDSEVAAQWDSIERELWNDELWAFITGGLPEFHTRIGYLLDRVAGVSTNGNRVPFDMFLRLKDRIDAGEAKAVWEEVTDLHSLLIGWYEDRDLYHWIGYLVSVGVPLGDLVATARHLGRAGFIQHLHGRIRTSLGMSSAQLLSLSYDVAADSRKLYRALLLMNVETVRQYNDASHRFSFRAHADHHWSLEHIHAQQAVAMNKAEEWAEWLESQRLVLGTLPTDVTAADADLPNAIIEVLAAYREKPDTLKHADFMPLHDRVMKLLSEDAGDIHSVRNLALLDGGQNAALSNATFALKRQKIIEMDKAGEYIPVCTRNVFLKYYTPNASQQLYLWSRQDRQAYADAILERLDAFLVEEDDQ